VGTPKHRTAAAASYFVTTRSWQGRSVFQVSEIANIVVSTIFRYRDQGAYGLHEFVLMPNHLHLLLTPSATTTLEKAIQLIKGGSSHEIHSQRGQKTQIWQVGFFDWTIRNASDWQSKVTYIHMNPVRERLVLHPEEWTYSSAAGRFTLDPVPERYRPMSSGAKAPMKSVPTPGLKPRPPKDKFA
jgi:putative transposase